LVSLSLAWIRLALLRLAWFGLAWLAWNELSWLVLDSIGFDCLGRNRIFSLPKYGRLVHAENLHTRSLVPFKRAFHYWAKALFKNEK